MAGTESLNKYISEMSKCGIGVVAVQNMHNMQYRCMLSNDYEKPISIKDLMLSSWKLNISKNYDLVSKLLQITL